MQTQSFEVLACCTTIRPAVDAVQSPAGGEPAAVTSGICTYWPKLDEDVPTCKRLDGVVVPMPTLTALAPVPPSTSALLSLTRALAPIAVALFSWALVPGPESAPTKVSK